MRRDFQKEVAVAPSVDELVFGRLAQRETAQNEGAGVVTDLLPAIFSSVPDQLNRLQLPETPLGDANMRKQGSYGYEVAGFALILVPSFRELTGEGVESVAERQFALFRRSIQIDVWRRWRHAPPPFLIRLSNGGTEGEYGLRRG